jgi:dinuclear metal center YbgI/SA1388 family protein
MKIKDIFPILEELAPLAYAEDFDNVGLLVGDKNTICTGILVCHDALESVVTEAIRENCNLIVCFHPILFSGIKKITGKNYVEKAILKAIKNEVAIYAIHTALDNHFNGVNRIFGEALGLKNLKILIPKTQFIQKLITFVPTNFIEEVKSALFKAGAGTIGNYTECSFTSYGKGTFKGNANSNPVIGEKNSLSEVEEIKLEVTFEKHLQQTILQAMRTAHPYEEVAYEIYTLENLHQQIGLGMIGELNDELEEISFLHLVKEKMQCEAIRHSTFIDKKIKKVAVLGGSGSFAITEAKKQKADAFVTADLKYHQFYESDNELLIVDIGHFESERYTKDYIVRYLKEKIANFAIVLSKENTNPIKYI